MYSVDVILFSQPLQCLLNGCMKRAAMVVGIESMHWFDSMDLLLPRLTWKTLLLRAYCVSQRPILIPYYGPIHWGNQPVTSWQADYIGPIPSWRGQRFVLSGIDMFWT